MQGVQDPELGFLADTVREEVELGLEQEQVRYAHELCERLRLPLESFAERSPYQLSGGEQRRLSLVTGLARRPLLLGSIIRSVAMGAFPSTVREGAELARGFGTARPFSDAEAVPSPRPPSQADGWRLR